MVYHLLYEYQFRTTYFENKSNFDKISMNTDVFVKRVQSCTDTSSGLGYSKKGTQAVKLVSLLNLRKRRFKLIFQESFPVVEIKLSVIIDVIPFYDITIDR